MEIHFLTVEKADIRAKTVGVIASVVIITVKWFTLLYKYKGKENTMHGKLEDNEHWKEWAFRVREV